MLPNFVDSLPLPEADAIARFETLIQNPLPEAYREFLSKTNGGLAEPEFFKALDGSVHEITFWFGLDEMRPDNPVSLIRRWNVAQLLFRGPASLINIGRSQAGNLLLLSLTGKDQGSVYLWFHDASPSAIWDKGPADESLSERYQRLGMRLLAPDLNQLLTAALDQAARQSHFLAQLAGDQ
ncbi:MAG: hypothetical protein CVV27_07800 [Candidatus Melainabacteria bacterium HGW-Melainabacteria-1]|nr:MAG: hypothetical protein CVV27_07800 [Candidatus Melainabacteria bacterium HGW-Melainabacteria-1]